MNKREWFKKIRRELEEVVQAAELFKSLDDSILIARLTPESWNILQCFDHLNLYNSYYLKELESISALRDDDDIIRYSWMGRKSIRMMEPNALKKQKTFNHMKPESGNLSVNVIDDFLKDQTRIRKIIDRAEQGQYSLNAKGVRIEFLKFFRMFNGETIEFLLSHELRHINQAGRIREAFKQPSPLIV